MPQSCPARTLVAQDSILPYRGFSIRRPWIAPVFPSVRPICRMEFGDTADWKSALPPGKTEALHSLTSLQFSRFRRVLPETPDVVSYILDGLLKRLSQDEQLAKGRRALGQQTTTQCWSPPTQSPDSSDPNCLSHTHPSAGRNSASRYAPVAFASVTICGMPFNTSSEERWMWPPQTPSRLGVLNTSR